MKKNKSLILKIFIYLSVFSFLILFFIWILQILLLNKYYEYYKTNELSNTLSTIKKNYERDNFYNILENVAYNTDFCIEITENTETTYSSVQNNKGCIDSNNNSKVLAKKIEFMKSNKDYFKLKIINPKFNNLTLLYGVKLDDESKLKIKEAMDLISEKFDEIRNSII